MWIGQARARMGVYSEKESFVPSSIHCKKEDQKYAAKYLPAGPEAIFQILRSADRKRPNASLSRVLDSPFVPIHIQSDCICIDYFVSLDNI